MYVALATISVATGEAAAPTPRSYCAEATTNVGWLKKKLKTSEGKYARKRI